MLAQKVRRGMKYVKFGFWLGITCLVSVATFAQGVSSHNSSRKLLLDVVRKSWSVERKEALVYLRVYTDGTAESHPMRKVDFRNIQLLKKQVPQLELTSLRDLLDDPATVRLAKKYDSYWGNKDFGYEYDITIPRSGENQLLVLVNFQPFLARKEDKPYPKQLERLSCFIWRLRSQVLKEPLEKNWLQGCSELGY
jgi:hypothetical protein